MIDAISKAMSTYQRAHLTKDHFYCMINARIYNLIENMAMDRVYRDLKATAGPVSERRTVPFRVFLFDQMIVNYGLYAIALKNMF